MTSRIQEIANHLCDLPPEARAAALTISNSIFGNYYRNRVYHLRIYENTLILYRGKAPPEEELVLPGPVLHPTDMEVTRCPLEPAGVNVVATDGGSDVSTEKPLKEKKGNDTSDVTKRKAKMPRQEHGSPSLGGAKSAVQYAWSRTFVISLLLLAVFICICWML